MSPQKYITSVADQFFWASFLITLQISYTPHAVPFGGCLVHSFSRSDFTILVLTLDSNICLAMLGFIWSKAVSLPVHNNVCFVFFYRPSRRRGKALPTGFATTYRGAYASEHATETTRKAVYLTPCEIPGEIAPKKRKKYARCFFLFVFLVLL